MDETTKKIVDRITVRYATPQKIPSGDLCAVFYDCIRLSPAELARLAAEATGGLDEDTFDMAVGIAYTGILFSAAVAGGRQVTILTEGKTLAGPPVKSKQVVVVDDVVHTGSRMREAARIVEEAGGKVVGFAAIIDRSDGAFGTSTLPLWTAFQTDMG